MFGASSKGQLLKHLAGGASIYGLAVVTSRICTFVLLPIFWKYLNPSDFGIIGIITLTQGFLVPLLSLGLHDTLQRFYPEWDEEQRQARLALIWSTIFVWSLILCGLLSYSYKIFNLFFNKVEAVPYFLIGIWTAFSMTFVSLALSLKRIKAEVKQFSFITAAVFLTQSTFSLFFVIVMSYGAKGYLLGGLCGATIWAIFLNFEYWRQAKLGSGKHKFKELLTYSLPMVPATILDGTTSLFDRYFLDKFVNLSTIGHYNVANQLSSALIILNQGLKSAWIPFLYRIMHDRKDAPSILGLFSFYYVAVLIPPALLICLVTNEIISLFDSRYMNSCLYLPWIVLTVYIQAITTAMGRGLDLAKKNHLWPLISAIQVIASLSALAFFVPKFGAIGAAWSIVIAAATRAICQILLANHAYPRPIYISKLLFVWSCGLAIYWSGMKISKYSALENMALKIIWVTVLSLIVAFTILDKDSKTAIWLRIRQYYKRN